MKLILKIFLTIIGFLGGYALGMSGLMFVFKLIEILFHIRFEAMWLLIGIIAFLGGVLAGIFSAVYLLKTFNKYYSKNNR